MASYVYTKALTAILNGDIDFAADDIRVALLMSNTTADTEEDIEFVGSFSTLDEMDGSGYARVALTTETVSETLASDRAEFDADDVAFGALGNGTRQVAGALVFKHVTNDAASIPIAWVDAGGFPFNPGGSNVTIQWNATGIITLSNA